MFTADTPIDGLDGLTVGDFWSWAYSGVLSNANRGVLVEFIVAVWGSGNMVAFARRAVFPLGLLLVFMASQLSVSGATAADGRSLNAVKDSARLVVGVDIPYGVMEFYGKDGKPAGIDIDIAKEIASAIGVVPEFRAMSFDSLFGALHDNEVDVVLSAVTITPERQKTLLFSVPYLSASTVLAIAKTNSDIDSVDDLGNGKLGVLKGTLGENLAKESGLLKGMTVVAYTDNDKRIDDLVAGKIDAAIVHFLVKTDLPIKIIGQPLSQNFYGVVANLGSKDLMAEVDKILRAMKRDGRLTAIKKRYIK